MLPLRVVLLLRSTALNNLAWMCLLVKEPKIIAIVPMRHNSERVPTKNYRIFAGRPLYHHVVQSLLACEQIAEVVIDTDSPIIMDDVRLNFPQIRLLERPTHLRDGSISMNDVLLNSTAQVSSDFYLQTHSTNPLLTTASVSRSIAEFMRNFPTYDSLFSVSRLQTRLWDGCGRPVNHNPSKLERTQDLLPLYEENSCIYIFSRKSLETRSNRIGERPLMFEMDRLEAWDIDEETDFEVGEILFQKREVSRCMR